MVNVLLTTNPRTLEVFEHLREFIEINGYAPSVRELGRLCFVSHTEVVLQLAKLEARGYIARTWVQ